MEISEETILMPGMIARLTSRDLVAVEIWPEADPIGLPPGVLDREKRRLGSRQLPDGTWKLSWRFRKEYGLEFDAAAGQRVFDDEWLEKQSPRVMQPLARMDLDEDGVLVKKDRGRLLIYQWPDAQPPELPEGLVGVSRGCGMGMDVSEGVGASDSTIEVFFADTREQAAELADAYIHPADLGRMAVAIATMYNDAVICCVRKMHGLTTLRAMADECEYPYLWHSKLATKMWEARTENLGWPWGELTDMLFSRWADRLQHDTTILHSGSAILQHREYQYDEKGLICHVRTRDMSPAQRRRHGDMVVACALADVACKDVPRFRAVVEKPPTHIEKYLRDRDARRKKPWRR